MISSAAFFVPVGRRRLRGALRDDHDEQSHGRAHGDADPSRDPVARRRRSCAPAGSSYRVDPTRRRAHAGDLEGKIFAGHIEIAWEKWARLRAPRPFFCQVPGYCVFIVGGGVFGAGGATTSRRVAIFLPCRTSYAALTFAPSCTSISVPCRPST
jgi:hypothetical protein